MLSNSDFLPSEKEFFEFLKIRFATVGIDFNEIEQYLLSSLEVSEKRFRSVKTKYFMNSANGNARFSATHYSGHALILYQLSRECFLNDRLDLAEKIYFLNTVPITAPIITSIKIGFIAAVLIAFFFITASRSKTLLTFFNIEITGFVNE